MNKKDQSFVYELAQNIFFLVQAYHPMSKSLEQAQILDPN